MKMRTIDEEHLILFSNGHILKLYDWLVSGDTFMASLKVCSDFEIVSVEVSPTAPTVQ